MDEKRKEIFDGILIHYGVKDQKWGHRNGPPYPLDPVKDYTAAQKKANPSLLNKAKNKLKEAAETHKKNSAEIKAAKVQAKAKMKKDVAAAKQQEKVNKVANRYLSKTNEKISKLESKNASDAKIDKAVSKQPLNGVTKKAVVERILADPTPEKVLHYRSIMSTKDIQDARAKMEELDRIKSRIEPGKKQKAERFIKDALARKGGDMIQVAAEAGTIYMLSKSQNPAIQSIASALKENRKSNNKNKNNNNNSNNN